MSNIRIVNKSFPVLPIWTTLPNMDPAIDNPGDAFWIVSPASITSPNSLTFSGRILNVMPAVASQVHLKLRYTFYRNSGYCSASICEKDVSY